MKKFLKMLLSIVLCISLTIVTGYSSFDLKISAVSPDVEVRKIFNDYVNLNGNDVQPDTMLSYINERIAPYTVTLEKSEDCFIYHAVDGVRDDDATYPINIPGHKGYISAILQLSDGALKLDEIGVIAEIDFVTEYLGTLTTDVYSANNSNFTTQDGVITAYTGTAEKIVIPESFSGTINLNGSTGKENVKAVYISGYEVDKRSLLKISASSFREWPELRAVVLPKRMSEIGNFAFYGCKQLKYVALPAGVLTTGYGDIKNDAFNACSQLENICYRPTLPSANIWSNVFSNTAIRDYYLASDSRFTQTNGSYIGVCGTKPTYTAGTTVIMTAAEQKTATLARAAVLARKAADDYIAENYSADDMKSIMDAAYSSKNPSISSSWSIPFVDDYGVLTLTDGVQSIVIEVNKSIKDSDLDIEIKKAFTEYVSKNGNNVEPEKMVEYINSKVDSKYTVEASDTFIYHAVDGVYDEGDATYPIEVAGYKGYMSAIINIKIGTSVIGSVGVIEEIPFATENLGVLTSDVYSVDNANFVTDESGNITGYTGNAEKIVISATFSGVINLKDCAGKDSVKAVYIGGPSANMESTSIANRSFNNWANLRAMVLPQYIGTINDWAISQNPNLKYIKLPYWVKPVFGKIGAAAFGLNPQLSTAHYGQGPLIPIGGYYGSVFEGTAIRDYYIQQHNNGYKLYNNSSDASNFGSSPSYTEGTQVVLTYAQQQTATFARAAVLAQIVAESKTVTDENQAEIKSQIVSAYSSKINGITAKWSDTYYSALVLNYGDNSIYIKCNDIEKDISLSIEVDEEAEYFYNDISGMVFTANVSDLGVTKNNPFVVSVDFGMLICPTDYVLNIDFTKESLIDNGKEFLDIPIEHIIENGDTTSFVGVISNIKQENYNRLFSARAYADITLINGTYTRIYSEYNREIHSERLVDIAKRELSQNSSLTEEQKTYFNNVISSINIDKPAVLNSAAGWVNPQRGGSESLSEELRNSIINSENEPIDTSVYTGTTYYVSPNGSDSNTGKSPDKPWKTFKNLTKKKYSFSKGLQAGDKVLFERGGVYRGTSVLVSGVYYGAYGEGDKPAIYGSAANLAQEKWNSNTANIWYISNVGNSSNDSVGLVVFNHGEEVGLMETEYSALDSRGDFYYDRSNDYLYVYSEGNPSEEYFSIEIGISEYLFIIEGTSKNITVDNLTLKYTGLHAISVLDGAENITIKNCEIGWIGGSYKAGAYDGVRYGNGVEFWNSCTNVSVEDCWVYQIYDSGLSHQGRITTDGKVFTVQGLTFRGNLIEYTSFGSIEYWTSNGADADGNVNMMKDILYEDNILRFAGYGWGDFSRPDKKGFHIYAGNYTNATDNFVIKNNVFDIARGGLVLCITSHPTVKIPTLTGNTYIQREGDCLGKYGYSGGLSMLYFDGAVVDNVKNVFKDTTATITVYK